MGRHNLELEEALIFLRQTAMRRGQQPRMFQNGKITAYGKRVRQIQKEFAEDE